MQYTTKKITIDAQEIVSVGTHSEQDGTINLALANGTDVNVILQVLPALIDYFRSAKQCGNHAPQKDDFFIFRDDGDNYLCPAKVFHEKYELVTSPPPAEKEQQAAA